MRRVCGLDVQCQLMNLYAINLTGVYGFDVSRMGDSVAARLRKLDLEDCNLSVVPADIGTLFPILDSLNLSKNRIKTLEGVTLPPLLKEITLNYNEGITLEGAILPQMRSIYMTGCKGLRGLSAVKFPKSIRGLVLTQCDIRWLGSSFQWPKLLVTLFVDGNPLMDTRWVKSTNLRLCERIQVNLNANRVYDAEDCIGLMLRGNVLHRGVLSKMRKMF